VRRLRKHGEDTHALDFRLRDKKVTGKKKKTQNPRHQEIYGPNLSSYMAH
jgi:hypothetical protein